MGKRKVTILEPAIEEVARIALYIEGEGLPKTAKKFVDDAFVFFETLSDRTDEDGKIAYNIVGTIKWKLLGMTIYNQEKNWNGFARVK